MLDQISLPVLYLILAIFVSSVINVYVWRKSQTRGSRAFVVACSTSILWMLGDVIGRLSTNLSGQWLGEIVRYIGGVTLPVALLVFIIQYCGEEINRKKVFYLLIIPAISWLILVTNHWHLLFFSEIRPGIFNSLQVEYGIYFWTVHIPYSYGVFLIGFFKIVLEFSRASRHYRSQILFLILSLFIPFAVNVIGVFRIFGEFSYTPLSFPIFFTLMSFAIFRYQFLGSSPIAYETVFKTIRDGVLILDQNDVIRDINPAAAKGLEKKPSEVIGFHVREAFKSWQSAIELYDQKPVELGEIEVKVFGTTRFLSIESTPLLTKKNYSEGRIITIRDITDRHRHQLSLEALAFHDPLTRLANRRKFQEEVEQAIQIANTKNENFAILYFDLNSFKSVNDQLGHDAGDELLKYVSARVASILRKPDILARLGGDEFSILLHNCNELGIKLVTKRILDNVRKPFVVGGNTLIAEVSIGAAIYPQNGKNLTELLRHADTAMYQAKQFGATSSIHNLNVVG